MRFEKEMATHSSTLAWRIPWREEPGRLQSMGSDTTEKLHFTSLRINKIKRKADHILGRRGMCKGSDIGNRPTQKMGLTTK